MDKSMEELKSLHERFKSDRHSKAGISLALRVDRRTVRRWFKGTSVPTEKHLKAIKNLVAKLKSPAPNL